MELKEFRKNCGQLRAKPAWMEAIPGVEFEFDFYNKNSWEFSSYIYLHHPARKQGAKLSETQIEEAENSLIRDSFVDLSFRNWRGLVEDGKEYTFTKERAKKLLFDLPDLFNRCVEFAVNRKNFEDVQDEEAQKDVGESVPNGSGGT